MIISLNFYLIFKSIFDFIVLHAFIVLINKKTKILLIIDSNSHVINHCSAVYFCGINRLLINPYSRRIVHLLAWETRRKKIVICSSWLQNLGNTLRGLHIIDATCHDVCNCRLHVQCVVCAKTFLDTRVYY